MNPPDPNPAPPATRPDAETAEAIYLIKNVSFLRATRQVRLLAFKAAQTGKTLILLLPPACRLDPALEELIRQMPAAVRRQDLSAP